MKKTIYYNGEILTMDKQNTKVDAVLVEDGKIAKVGKFDEIEKDENTSLFDLEGKTMLPGFIDPHGHIVAIAQTLMITNLSETKSIQELKDMLKESLEKNPPAEGEWLIGFGYDNTNFEGENHPTKFDLDEVTKDIPIFISHASGHLAVANSKALEKFGYVGENYTVPEGGIVRTVKGTNEPNGILEENACLDPEKRKVIPTPSPQTMLNCVKKAQELYASFGITTCQDASVDVGMHKLLEGASKAGMLFIDIVGFAVQQVTMQLLKDEGTPKREYVNHYKLLGGKTWLDGSPQGKTAWLTKPYYEAPEGQPKDYCGYGTQDDETVTKYLKTLIDNNIQANAHCNGDAASDQFIRCYKEALKQSGNKKDLRPVMVHCQTVREDQLDEMKEIGMLPTFFLDHIWYWGDYHYESVLGPERSMHISPAKSALVRGMNYTLHQDPPVKLPNQILAIHNAVNRKTQSGRILGEDQCLTTIEALRGVTINGAYQYFEEDTKGSIEVGKVADFVVLDKNPLSVNKNDLKTINVLKTIKEDNIVFEK